MGHSMRRQTPPTPAADSPQPDTARSIYYALGANGAILIAKTAGAVITGSSSLLAESMHSLADTANQVLLLVGRKQAKAPASAHHPLGHGRATYFWSFVVALLLFNVGGLLSIAEGIRKLHSSDAIDHPWFAVAILVFAMGAEGISLRMALSQIAKVRGDLGLWRWFRLTRRSELIVVLAEDLGAVVGLTLALAALLLAIVTGDPVYDAWGSIAIGVLLMVVASALVVETRSLLIGESASPKTRRAIRAFLKAQPDVAQIHSLVTMQQGEELLIAVQARMTPQSSANELVAAIARCKESLQREFPQATWVVLEPIEAPRQQAENAQRPLQSGKPKPRRRAR
ncbi:MAG: cation diffusion facilitator family transporter [Betaproteobacteria bacterium]